MGTEFSVTEIRVSGSFKNWSDPRGATSGISGGSEFEITVVPPQVDSGDRVYWTSLEAQVVALDIRMQIHVLLMADAQNRGVPLPHDAQTTLIRYREKVTELKTSQNECNIRWRDADVPPPVDTPGNTEIDSKFIEESFAQVITEKET